MSGVPAFVIGSARTGRTNMVRNLITMAGAEKIYLFDNRSHNLGIYQTKENIIYAEGTESAKKSLERIRTEITLRKEAYEEERLDNVALTLAEYCKTLEPVYVAVDGLQELYESLGEDNEWMDLLADAVDHGFQVLVTSEMKVKKMTKSRFFDMLLSSREALILGNIKDQILFSYTGIREENRKTEFGYYHNSGENRKVKLIHSREQEE